MLVANETLFTDQSHSWTALPHYMGPLSEHKVQLNFCEKRSSDTLIINGQWPSGRYCVYRKHRCPDGMTDEILKLEGYRVQNTNIAMGNIDFMYETYDSNIASVHFTMCCMEKETESTKLPNSKPFIMINPSSEEHCQPIDGTEVKQEWFSYMMLIESPSIDRVDISSSTPAAYNSTPDTFNDSTDDTQTPHVTQTNTIELTPSTTSDLTRTTTSELTLTGADDSLNVSYCFYKPYKRRECKYLTDEGASYRGRRNVTRLGLPCLPWKEITGLEYSNVLEENYCRPITDRQLDCYVNLQDKHQQMDCVVDYCRDQYGNIEQIQNKYRNIAFFRPVTSNHKAHSNLKHITDGLKWMNIYGREYDAPGSSEPWITIHLGAQYLIHAVTLYRNRLAGSCFYPYKWTNIAVWIHTFESEFESHGAHLCSAVEDLLDVCNIEIHCVQPMTGYYVTVQAHLDVNSIAPTEVRFEEIEVYGEVTKCDQLFNMWEDGLYNYQVMASNGMRRTAFSFRKIEGCFDKELNITIDLLVPMTLEGVAVTTQDRSCFKLYVLHGDDHMGTEKKEEFMIVTENEADFQHKYFNKNIFTRTVTLMFVAEPQTENICLAFDLIGCPKIVERDPLCTNNASVIGVSMETNTEIIVDVESAEFVTTITDSNITACLASCMDDTDCLTWDFSHDNDTCSLIPASYYRTYHTSNSEISTVRKKEYDSSQNTTTLSGEKICAKEVEYKYSCDYDVILGDEVVYISSRNYPGPYLADMYCTWTVRQHDNISRPVKVTFLDLEFMPPRYLIKFKHLHDSCTDLISINGFAKAPVTGPHLVLSNDNATSFIGATTYMEATQAIYIQFTTCIRRRVWQAFGGYPRGFSLKIERADCPGCRNDFTTCHDVSTDITDDVMQCSAAQCGYISNMNYMGQTDQYKLCHWYIQTSSVLQIEFLHFDIPSDDDCNTNALILYAENKYTRDNKFVTRRNFSESAGWYPVSKFCNAQKPLTVMYMSTDIGLEYMSDSGTGFLMKWQYIYPHQMNQSLSFQPVNDISKYCGVNKFDFRPYELFLEYPYKCYMIDRRTLTIEPDGLNWIDASKICEEYGGKLVEIMDRLEEELILQVLRDHKVNGTFLGFTKDHKSGFLLNADNKNNYQYMNWGYNEESGTLEPNGLGESTCIMLQDILNLTTPFKQSKWADVSCYEIFKVLVICEKPLITPYTVKNRTSHIVMSAMTDTGVRYPDRLYRCENGEYILAVLHCDQVPHCTDQSDENNCDYITECGTEMFNCGDMNQQCIHINLTCDFITDCMNGADEINCVYAACDESSWRCNNGQCIPASQRLDQKYDCYDQSDETVKGKQWTLGFTSASVVNARTTSNVFVEIYSDTGVSHVIFIDNTEFLDGKTVNAYTIIDIHRPYKIRVKLDNYGPSPYWYLNQITLVEEGSDTEYIFQCDCRIPNVTTPWLTYTDISVSDPITLIPMLASTVYTITVRTGSEEDAGTNNDVYIAIYGHQSDSGIFQLKNTHTEQNHTTFQAFKEDIFTYQTPNLGDIIMIKVYHFGEYIDDQWLVEEISVHDSVNNETVMFNIDRWLSVNIEDKHIAVMFYAYLFHDMPDLSYINGTRCPNYMFECIDGMCIPQSQVCDQIVHCHGPFHEDEPLVCTQQQIGRSCAHILSYPETREGFYDVLLESGTRSYRVHCMPDEDVVITRIHHNQEYWMAVTDSGNIDITYSISTEGIDLLKHNSEFCQQTIEVGCFHVYDKSWYENIIVLQHDGTQTSLVNSSMSCDNDKSCSCHKNMIEWFAQSTVEFSVDKVVFNTKHQVPITAVEILNLLELPSQLRLNVGSLDCFKSAVQTKDSHKPCRNRAMYNATYRCILEYDDYRTPYGCKDLSHLSECEFYKCDVGYVKCPSSYCIPLHYVCNGVQDCQHGEDELSCRDVECGGSLRCRRSRLCVDDIHVCDGRNDCPMHDDELICDATPRSIRSLSPTTTAMSFKDSPYVASLNLADLNLSHLNQSMFQGLYNLLSLDLSYNDIIELDSGLFTDLSRLEMLKLAGNSRFRLINPGAFKGLKSMKEKLDLSNMKISTVFTGTFEGFDSLKVLNLSYNHITTLEDNAFSGMDKLERLYIHGNGISEFSSAVFDGLPSLKVLVSDLYLLCCIRPSTVTQDQCFPAWDEFSSCDDLMSNELLRYFVWIIGMFALFGNALALVYRIVMENLSFRTGNGVLLTNLCVADFLMGVYMLIIASADTHFRGEYVWNDITWRRGNLCKLAGVLSFISSEASGAFLCLITIDRWLTIRYTLKRAGFTKTSALYTCSVLWLICIILAVLPIIGLEYFNNDFYSKSGVCLALPLTPDRKGGWEYAAVIFIFLNFAMFVFVAVGQLLIFREIRKANMAVDGKQKRDDVAIARKLLLIVMTNFLCWFPICIMGLVAMFGVVFYSEVYAWVAVFVLPLNSATNPVLYTLSSIFTSDLGYKIKEKLTRRKTVNHPSEQEEAEKLEKLADSGLIRLHYEPNVISLTKYMEQHKLSLVENVHIAKVLATALDLLHTLGYVAGPFSTDEVLISLNSYQEMCKVSLMSIPLYSDTIDDVSSDIADLGLVIKKMSDRPKRLSKKMSKRRHML